MALTVRPACETCDFRGPELDTFTAAHRGAHRPLHDLAWVLLLSPADWLLRRIINDAR